MSENGEELIVNDEQEAGFFSSLGRLFFEPSKSFPVFVEKKSWVWFPIVLITLLTFLSTYTFFERVDRESFMTKQLSKSKFTSNMSQEQIDKAINDFKETKGAVRGLIAIPFYLVWLMLLGGSLKFLNTLIVVFWAEVVISLKQFISIFIMLMKKGEDLLSPENIVLSSVGSLIGSEKLPPALFSFLSSIDIFAIWNLVLLTIGLSLISKLSIKYSAFVIFTLYFLKVAIQCAFVFFTVQ
jgi:hypothetical protein